MYESKSVLCFLAGPVLSVGLGLPAHMPAGS
jgi:hypothetical protein